MESNKKTINTQKLFLYNMHHFVKYVFSGQILPMTAILSVGFIFLPFFVLIYIVLFPILLMMAYKLAFDVLAETAQGNMSPEIRLNYLVTNAIAIKVLIVALLIEGVSFYLKKKGVDEDLQFYFILITAFLTPAIYMSLALTNSLMHSLNPLTLFNTIKVTNLSYFLFVVFWVASISLHEYIINPLVFEKIHPLISGVVSGFIEFTFLVLNFHILGYILFQHRRELDLEAIGFKKISDDYVEVEIIQTNPSHAVIKNHLNEDEVERALAMIIAQQKSGDRSSTIQELYKQAVEMKLYSPSNLDIAHKINRRLNNNQDSKAFNIYVEHVEKGGDFVEISPEDIKQLVEHAIVINKTQYIANLVENFHEKYPYHKDIVPNYFLLAKTLYLDRATRNQSKNILISLIQKHPKDTGMNEVKSWLKGLELIEKRTNRD